MRGPGCGSSISAPAPAARPWRWRRRCNNRGHLVACDVAAKRLERADAAAAPRRRQQCRSASRCRASATNGSSATPPASTACFVDAPCTGTGTWRRNPDAKWRLQPEDLAELPALQADILDSAAAAGEAGRPADLRHLLAAARGRRGRRSTTSSPPHADFSLVPDRAMSGPTRSAATARRADDTLRLTPARHGTDGFFVAVLERKPARKAPDKRKKKPRLPIMRAVARKRAPMVDIRLAHPEDAAAIARVHVAMWETSYRGLIDDALIDEVTVEQREAMWGDILTAYTETHPVLVADGLRRRRVRLRQCGSAARRGRARL